MGFWKECYDVINASDPMDRLLTFLIGLILAGLMLLATLDIIIGIVFIILVMIGVI